MNEYLTNISMTYRNYVFPTAICSLSGPKYWDKFVCTVQMWLGQNGNSEFPLPSVGFGAHDYDEPCGKSQM